MSIAMYCACCTIPDMREFLSTAARGHARVWMASAEYNIYLGKNGIRSYPNLIRPILAGRSMNGTSNVCEKVRRRLVSSVEKARLARARRCCRA